MKNNYNNMIGMILLIMGISISGATKADILNSDFSDNLTHWSGDYSFFDGTDEFYFDPITDFDDFSANVSTGSNSITLTTSTDGLNEYFGFYLFQEFEVSATAFELSLNFNAMADDVYVTLVDDNFDLIHDFINDGLVVDISHLAGQSVSLEFGIEDWYQDYDDILTVSNITISQQAVSVPEPSSLAIFAFALLALRKRLYSNKTTGC
jgi:hypothetical protein